MDTQFSQEEMERNLAQGSMAPSGAPYCGLDLQGSLRYRHQPQQPPHVMHHQQQLVHRQGSSRQHLLHDSFPLTMGTMHSSDQPNTLADFMKEDRGKNSVSDEEPSYTEDGPDCHHDSCKGKKGLPWQRVKWTDKMVKLLINAISYMGEDATSDCGGGFRRKLVVLQKKGKWKLVSKVMAERSFHVSPQQCEDKFNDLNKRYKKLNDMLGRGTSCQVVENPALLDVIDYLSEKDKDDVRKILSSKHLFYEEMCSCLNGNRLHLPHDEELQRSLQLALRSKEDHDYDDARMHQHSLDEDPELDSDDHDDNEENHASLRNNRRIYGALGSSAKMLRRGQGREDACFGNPSKGGSVVACTHPQIAHVDMNQVTPESARAAQLQKQWMESRTFQLEEQKVQIQAETLELEKQRFRWQRFCKKRDHELEKFRMENERMRLENDHMALELKRKEMSGDFN